MKKTTLVLLMLFVTVLLPSQNQLLSSREQFFDTGSNTWQDVDGENYTYDSNNRLSVVDVFSIDFETSNWTQTRRETYVYNTNSSILTEQNFDENTNTFVNDFRTTVNKDNSGVITDLIDEIWNGSQWVNDFRLVYNYSAGRLDNVTGQEWNGTSWVVVDRGSLNYDSNDRITSLIFEEFENGFFVPSDRELLTYDANGSIERNILEVWNGTSYVEEEREEFVYSASGNRLSSTETFNMMSFTSTFDYDTSVVLSSLTTPFRDRDIVGLEYISETFPFFNKVLLRTSNEGGNRTVYDYENSIVLSNDNFEVGTKISLHPNPAQDFLNIESSQDIINVEIFDVLGKKVLASNKQNLNISGLRSGVYIVKISDATNQIETKRFIKK